jgi:hypothetical protein
MVLARPSARLVPMVGNLFLVPRAEEIPVSRSRQKLVAAGVLMVALVGAQGCNSGTEIQVVDFPKGSTPPAPVVGKIQTKPYKGHRLSAPLAPTG